MHAASKVETEVHRQTADRKEPLGRVRHEIERSNVARILRIGVERVVDHFAGLKLLFGLSRIKPHANRVLLGALFEKDAVRVELGVRKRRLHAVERVFGHLDGSLARRDLHRRRLAVEVRQRVDEPDDEHDADHDVFPKRIAIHPLTPSVQCAKKGFTGPFVRRNLLLRPCPSLTAQAQKAPRDMPSTPF